MHRATPPPAYYIYIPAAPFDFCDRRALAATPCGPHHPTAIAPAFTFVPDYPTVAIHAPSPYTPHGVARWQSLSCSCKNECYSRQMGKESSSEHGHQLWLLLPGSVCAAVCVTHVAE
mmetsp:Transcript_94484/g.283168  ORF Transcript_94484/g.283168 Transcript_94484/m.283168 type:complete len:117 (+) Transcript_94484:246-596(+)